LKGALRFPNDPLQYTRDSRWPGKGEDSEMPVSLPVLCIRRYSLKIAPVLAEVTRAAYRAIYPVNSFRGGGWKLLFLFFSSSGLTSRVIFFFGMSRAIGIPFFNEADGTAQGRFRRYVADGRTAGAAAESPVREQGYRKCRGPSP